MLGGGAKITTDIHTHIHTYIHTYIQTHRDTDTQTHTHTHTHSAAHFISPFFFLRKETRQKRKNRELINKENIKIVMKYFNILEVISI